MRATIEDLDRLDIRAGTVVRCEPFPEARTPAYKLWIDSEVLTLGLFAEGDVVVLVGPDREVPDGSRLG